MTQKYRVVISGHTRSGQTLSATRDGVRQAFGLRGDQLDRMLSGRPATVARSLDEAAADAMVRKLHALDLEAIKQALAPADLPPSVAPAPTQTTARSAGTPQSGVQSATQTTAHPAAQATTKPVPQLPSPGASSSEELFTLVPNARAAAIADPSKADTGPGDDERVCPKCGEVQPKRTLCRQCGLDMPRFIAAQEEGRRQAAEQKAAASTPKPPASVPAGHDDDDAPSARLLGFGFSGRLGRIAYLLSMVAATLIFVVLLGLAVVTEKKALMQLGLLLSTVYSVRCLVLRLHDTGRTGWLWLVSLVPIVNLLMLLALLLVPGDYDENDYGPPPRGTGFIPFLATAAITLVLSSAIWHHMSKTPENLVRYMAMLQALSSSVQPGSADDDDDGTGATANSLSTARYATHNQVDIYVITDCERCDEIRNWLDSKGLKPTIYWVDRSQSAGERLHERIGGGNRQVQLPVLEVNGKLLADNPGLGDIHRHLKQE